MEVKVEQAADFFRVVDPAYDRFVRAAADDARFEVVLAGDEFRGENLKLMDLHGVGSADVSVHPAHATSTRLSGGYVQISARSIDMERIVLSQVDSSYPALALTARNSIRLTKCGFIDLQHRPSYAGEWLMQMRPGFRADEPAQLHIDQCAWIGTMQAQNSSLLSLADAQRRWSSVTFDGCVFLANQAGQGIVLGGAGEVTFRNCFLHTFPAFLVIDAPVTRVTLENCIILHEGDDWMTFTAAAVDAQERYVPERIDDDAPQQERIVLLNNRTYARGDAARIDVEAVKQGHLPEPGALESLLKR
ncbi:MAG: right-handed parallel beta-helix repeat-containing protein [Anaerolinea sp.]|nr:right-handed parallel beta-helix repeat-containing protein [Anaerolinea sp.]